MVRATQQATSIVRRWLGPALVCGNQQPTGRAAINQSSSTCGLTGPCEASYSEGKGRFLIPNVSLVGHISPPFVQGYRIGKVCRMACCNGGRIPSLGPSAGDSFSLYLLFCGRQHKNISLLSCTQVGMSQLTYFHDTTGNTCLGSAVACVPENGHVLTSAL